MSELWKKFYVYWQDRRYRSIIKLGLYLVGFTIVLIVFLPRAKHNLTVLEEKKEAEIILEKSWHEETVYNYYLDFGLEDQVLVTVVNDFSSSDQEIDEDWLMFNRLFLKILVDDGVLVSETTDHVNDLLVKKYLFSFELNEEIYNGEMILVFDEKLRKVEIKFDEMFLNSDYVIIDYVD